MDALYLQQDLDKLLDEKQSDLIDIHKLIFASNYNFTSKHINILQIQAVFMLYAIWEGFIKSSFKIFIDRMNETCTPLSKYKDSIIVFHMENYSDTSKIAKNEYPKEISKKFILYNKIRENFDNTKIFNILSTGNANFDTIKKTLNTFCLGNIEDYWKKYRDENNKVISSSISLNKLVSMRNTIAHRDFISNKDYSNEFVLYKDTILDLMYEIHRRMIECFNNKDFLRTE